MLVCAISELLILLNQLSADGIWPQDDGVVALQKGEAAAEKNAASNQANDRMTCNQRDGNSLTKEMMFRLVLAQLFNETVRSLLRPLVIINSSLGDLSGRVHAKGPIWHKRMH